MPVGVYIRTKQHREALSKAHMGHKQTEATKTKLRIAFSGKKNPMYGLPIEQSPNWKGDKAEPYQKVHRWIRKQLGQPKHCWNCGSVDAKVFDWANISHDYRYDITDWFRLCRSCHIAYDRGKLELPDDKRGAKEIE